MPSNIKTVISLLVAIVGAVAFWLERGAGRPDIAWVAAVLAAFMILAMWIFPEAKRKD
jgi:hypothetical protein